MDMAGKELRDPQLTALEALGWILLDERRAQRFLELTGLSPATLRKSVASNATQRAVLEFLCAHEPDLLAAATALDISPGEFAAALERLDR